VQNIQKNEMRKDLAHAFSNLLESRNVHATIKESHRAGMRLFFQLDQSIQTDKITTSKAIHCNFGI
jgi:hypothetical protein